MFFESVHAEVYQSAGAFALACRCHFFRHFLDRHKIPPFQKVFHQGDTIILLTISEKVKLYLLLYHKARIGIGLVLGVRQPTPPGNGIPPGKLRRIRKRIQVP